MAGKQIDYSKEILKIIVPVEGWEDVYAHPSGKLFKITEVVGHNNGRGYEHVKVFVNGKKYSDYKHRIIAKTFIPNPDGYKTIDHIDGDKSNNSVSNLRWLTLISNIREHFKSEYVLISPKGKYVKFTGIREFSDKFGLDSSAVSKVLRGKLGHTKGWRLPMKGYNDV